MHRYVILTNRKRAIVALVHSVAFLGIALYGATTVVRPVGRASPTSAWILAGVYVAVSLALAALTAMAGNWRERRYFGFCTTSAGFGLLRQILGDPPLHYESGAGRAKSEVPAPDSDCCGGFGLLRQILGDPPLHYAVYVRIV